MYGCPTNSEAVLESGEPLAVFYPLPQHFLPLVFNSSFCPLADVLTEDTVEAVGRAHGGSVTARTRAVFLCCGAGCLDCRAGQGRVLATDAVPGAFSLLIKASLPKKLKRNQDPLHASLDLHQT